MKLILSAYTPLDTEFAGGILEYTMKSGVVTFYWKKRGGEKVRKLKLDIGLLNSILPGRIQANLL
ncbi:MarR family transcriptional regulator [Sesbania bispinosa]|nr:MarR family transcriptional regulator [Sesbania bispinosa]